MDKNYKSQITIPNDPNSKLKEKIYCFGHWNFDNWDLFGNWCLEFGI